MLVQCLHQRLGCPSTSASARNRGGIAEESILGISASGREARRFESSGVAANKRIFVAMGGTPVTRGTAETVRFPGARVNLNLGDEPSQQRAPYSITSSACASSVAGTSIVEVACFAATAELSPPTATRMDT